MIESNLFSSCLVKAIISGWHENRDPGTHNYQLDNREQAYGFFDKHFGISASSAEIPSDSEIRPANELAVGLPSQNFAISAPADAPVVIVLNDKGYKASAEMVSEHINRGEQVLALDLLFNGATLPQEPDSADWETLVATTGGRPLGLEAAQLLALVQWLRARGGNSPVRIETEGFRSQVIAVTAAALQPGVVRQIQSHQGVESLGFLLAKSVPFRSAPDLFCLDLYKYFDLDRLSTMAAPTDIKRVATAYIPQR